MADVGPDLDDMANDAAETVAGPIVTAYWAWLDSAVGRTLMELSPDTRTAAAFTAGWQAGGHYLASRVAAELGIVATLAASDASPDGDRNGPVTGVGWPS